MNLSLKLDFFLKLLLFLFVAEVLVFIMTKMIISFSKYVFGFLLSWDHMKEFEDEMKRIIVGVVGFYLS